MTDTEQWFLWQQKVLNEEDYTEIVKRIRDKAQRQVDSTVKDSLVQVEKKK